ncbi:hypothetical protein HID58_008357 [Brassica napus]|uniref:Uncharacterized protein n=1 Tax=Brassica napus TaxID=3708 RepID=A0ABQ8DRV9_BRANA|nr:hypothetical protein HID58_008357 [Brassica napus]
MVFDGSRDGGAVHVNFPQSGTGRLKHDWILQGELFARAGLSRELLEDVEAGLSSTLTLT